MEGEKNECHNLKFFKAQDRPDRKKETHPTTWQSRTFDRRQMQIIQQSAIMEGTSTGRHGRDIQTIDVDSHTCKKGISCHKTGRSTGQNKPSSSDTSIPSTVEIESTFFYTTRTRTKNGKPQYKFPETSIIGRFRVITSNSIINSSPGHHIDYLQT